MRLFSWLSSFQKSLTLGRARRSRRSIARLERLEDRLVPTVTSTFAAGLLTVSSDAGGDSITITATGGSGGQVNVNGVIAVAGTTPADINGILVNCNITVPFSGSG